MTWEVEFTNEFEKWWTKLSEREQIAVATRVEELRRRGPGLRRPLVDRIESSRHRGTMRELRCPTSIRVLFAFGPSSTAILLIGGNKGDEHQDEPDWNGWYLVYVPIADDLYIRLPARTEARGEPKTMSVVKGKFDDLTAELKARPGYGRKAAIARAEMEREIEEYNLNQLRMELQITQAELARRLGISQSGVSQLLRQGSTIEAIRRIVEALGGDLELTAIVDGRRYPISA